MQDEHGAARDDGARQERRDAVANRARLLAAARQLFAAQGVDATSMNQVAQAAQVGAGTLYRHFAHKGELCGALLGDDIAAFQARAAELLAGPGAPAAALARLDLLIAELAGMLDCHIPLLVAMQETGAKARRNDPFESPFYTWLHQQIAGLLDDAAARGELRPLDSAFAADALLAAMSPPLFAFQRQGRGFSLERIVAGARRLIADQPA